ncbi:response regulator [Aquitalea pelogenes]|uniref:response regulator n=1 Tax=Aquitalea pelogenes TaxID=1293573 RepID=UPI000AB007A8|nr:response regulator [Aquitalea pelogenes]
MAPHILIIEDDIHLSQLIAAYLTKHGYQVSQHGRGDTAADVILDTRPDLVILDVMLPGKEGFDVCREVRLRYHGRILIMTARMKTWTKSWGWNWGPTTTWPSR